MVSSDTSNVPPPRSKIITLRSADPLVVFLSRPYAMAAAVGSLMIRSTLSPAITPASFVAWRCESLKYAGTVTTAFFTSLPRYASAISIIGLPPAPREVLEDRVDDRLELLLLLLVLLLLGRLVRVEPRDGLVDLVLDRLLVLVGQLARELLVGHRVLHRVRVVLERVLRLDAHAVRLVLRLVALGLLSQDE